MERLCLGLVFAEKANNELLKAGSFISLDLVLTKNLIPGLNLKDYEH